MLIGMILMFLSIKNTNGKLLTIGGFILITPGLSWAIFAMATLHLYI